LNRQEIGWEDRLRNDLLAGASYFIVNFCVFLCLLWKGFCYMQDTLLALEALTEFSYRQTNREFYNLQLVFECTSNSTWTHTVRLNKTNFANLFSFGVSCLCIIEDSLTIFYILLIIFTVIWSMDIILLAQNQIIINSLLFEHCMVYHCLCVCEQDQFLGTYEVYAATC